MTPSGDDLPFHLSGGTNGRQVPFSPTPFAINRALYKQALRLQPIFQRVVRRIIEERHLLESICKALSPTDDFVRQLYEIWSAYPAGEITLDVTRSDYMLHCVGESGERGEGAEIQLKQVELNTISVSFAHLSAFLSRPQPEHPAIIQHNADQKICSAFMNVLNLHSPDSVAIMVVSPNETNLRDQLGLAKLMGGRMFRMTWDEIRRLRVSIGGAGIDKCLNDLVSAVSGNPPPAIPSKDPIRLFLADGATPVGLIYYRTGYDPSHYGDAADWALRRLLEASNATKVPDMGAHLAGLKRVQQVLTSPGVLEALLPDDQEESISQLRASFVHIYSLDPIEPQAEEAVQLALAQPADWVIKPQREGGGHNIYGENISRFLQASPPSQLSNYILMERIRAPTQPALLFHQGLNGSEPISRQNEQLPVPCISELGIYGVQLCVRGQTLINEAVGHLVRTKEATQGEGGVMTGHACLANLIVDEDR